MKYIIPTILLTVFACLLVTQLVPIRKTIVKTVTNSVSLIAEKQKCDKAGGDFTDTGNLGYSWVTFTNSLGNDEEQSEPSTTSQEISCIVTTTNQIFDYKFSN